jgi:ribose transport system substrate-binding protein
MAIGAMAAIEQAGRKDEMWIVGGAGMKEIIKRIMDGDAQIPVNVTYPPAQISTAIELTALKYVSAAPVTGRFIIGSTLVTPENAAQFYFPDSPF